MEEGLKSTREQMERERALLEAELRGLEERISLLTAQSDKRLKDISKEFHMTSLSLRESVLSLREMRSSLRLGLDRLLYELRNCRAMDGELSVKFKRQEELLLAEFNTLRLTLAHLSARISKLEESIENLKSKSPRIA